MTDPEATESSADPLVADDPSRARADEAALPRKLKGIVQNVERIDWAGELLMDYTPRQAARKLAARSGIGFDRAEDYIEGALLLMSRSEERVTPGQRRVLLLEKARKTWRMATERQRAYNTPGGVELVDEPDLKAMQHAVELEAKLCGLDDAPAERRVWAEVIAALREGLSPSAFHDAIVALGKASGKDAAPVLPASAGKAGEDEAG